MRVEGYPVSEDVARAAPRCVEGSPNPLTDDLEHGPIFADSHRSSSLARYEFLNGPEADASCSHHMRRGSKSLAPARGPWKSTYLATFAIREYRTMVSLKP